MGFDKKYESEVRIVEDYFKNRSFDMLMQPRGQLVYPYIDPGAQYSGQSWDWDSYFSALALMEICEYFKEDREFDYEKRREAVIESAKGYILNFLRLQLSDGFIPIMVHEKMGMILGKKNILTMIMRINISRFCVKGY